jgi:hypothetical protein
VFPAEFPAVLLQGSLLSVLSTRTGDIWRMTDCIYVGDLGPGERERAARMGDGEDVVCAGIVMATGDTSGMVSEACCGCVVDVSRGVGRCAGVRDVRGARGGASNVADAARRFDRSFGRFFLPCVPGVSGYVSQMCLYVCVCLCMCVCQIRSCIHEHI